MIKRQEWGFLKIQKSNLIQVDDPERGFEDISCQEDFDALSEATKLHQTYTQNIISASPIEKRLLAGVFYSKFTNILAKDIEAVHPPNSRSLQEVYNTICIEVEQQVDQKQMRPRRQSINIEKITKQRPSLTRDNHLSKSMYICCCAQNIEENDNEEKKCNEGCNCAQNARLAQRDATRLIDAGALDDFEEPSYSSLEDNGPEMNQRLEGQIDQDYQEATRKAASNNKKTPFTNQF